MVKKKIIINNITNKNNNIIVEIDNKEYTISSNCYLDLLLYPKKEISNDDLNKIINDSNSYKIDKYIKKIIFKSRYTIKEIKEKILYKFQINEEDLDSYLSYYINENILNDYEYTKDYLESKNNSCYGRNYFLSILTKKGISNEIIHKEEINELLDQNNKYIESFINEYIKKKTNLNGNKLKDNVITYFINRGFEYNLINLYVSKINFDSINNIKNINKKIINDIKLCKDKNLDKYKIKEKIIKKYLNYGISIEELNEILKENIND